MEEEDTVLQEFNRRLIHLEECGSTKANEIEIMVKSHEKSIDRLTVLYERGVIIIVILSFVSGANAVINLIEKFVH